jgi:aldehyde:ferredoxin oxidoreductase
MDFYEEPKMEVIEAVTGYNFTPHLLEIGTRIYNLERMILAREGVRRADDQLPERIVKEAVPSGPIKGQVLTQDMYESMLDEYYEVRGWDTDGVPTQETLNNLGLQEIVA